MPISKSATYRRKKGLSQEQLAVLSGVSARTIQRIEKDTVEAHPAMLKMLDEALDVDTEVLLKGEPAVAAATVGKANRLVPSLSRSTCCLYLRRMLFGLNASMTSWFVPEVCKKD